jgi:predicted PurR-regulated permease PerM
VVDHLSTFLAHHRVKRLTALAVFITALVLLRHLATLLVFYLIFSRGLGWLSARLAGLTRIGARVWVGAMVVVLLGGVGAAGYAGVLRSLPFVTHFREHQERVQERLESFKTSDLYKMIEARHLDPEKYGEQVKQLSHSLLQGARTTGRTLLHLVIGLILAVLYLFERREVDEALARVPADSFGSYLLHYCEFTAEAIVLTIKVQVIVALVNAVITLPVMIALRLPHIPTLMLMVFAFGLVPVVGNFLSGAVLVILAYLKRGWLGVAIFVVSTFVLHKIESYYLNPRLTAKHVKLPSLILITSLIIFEHLFGLVGVFLSFPTLYVALKIRELYREVDVRLTAPPPPAALERTG